MLLLSESARKGTPMTVRERTIAVKENNTRVSYFEN
jgi:hypothetical protein